jgi:nicotinamidase/pyrazinamidase
MQKKSPRHTRWHAARMSSPPPSPCLIIVDVQNDYVMPSGALPCPDAEAIIPCIRDAAHSGRFTAGVYLSADVKPPASVPVVTCQSAAARWPPHCIAGSFGARVHEGLQHELLPDAVVVTKSSSMSAFGSSAKGETTQLRGLMQRRAPSHAVVCGLALEYSPLQHWHTHSHNRMHGEVCDALWALQVLRDGDRPRLRGHAAGGLRRAGRLQVLRVRRRQRCLPCACGALARMHE